MNEKEIKDLIYELAESVQKDHKKGDVLIGIYFTDLAEAINTIIRSKPESPDKLKGLV